VATELRARSIEPWPLILAGGLLLMMAISLSFYAIARTHPDAVLVQDAYEAGLRYNALLAERRAAAALGVDLELAVARGDTGIDVRVVVRDRNGARVAADAVVVRRERPAEGGLDADFRLTPDGDDFAGEVPLPRPGRWRLVVTATVEGTAVRESFALGGRG
jgi:nitrogen fixation protein FixH